MYVPRVIDDGVIVGVVLLHLGRGHSTQDGTTPLHDVAFKGHKDVVQLLLDRGAEPNMADQNGDNPLHKATSKGHTDVVHLLRERGAEPNIANDFGRTALYYALYIDIANILTEKGGTE